MSLAFPAPASTKVIERLSKIVGAEHVSVSPINRLAYARDMSPMVLLRQSEGLVDHYPDVVVWPGSEDEVAAVVREAGELDMPIVPFGAGSGVAGGVLPIRGGITVDVKRLQRIHDVSDEDLTVAAEAGVMGQTLENELNHRGYTMGHFPSSIYCSTLGGWIAARSAGQMSSLYGKIEDMILGMTWVLPGGRVVKTPAAPRALSGPDFKQLFIGSEGTLGIVTSAVCRIWPAPAARRFAAFQFPDVQRGTAAMREIMQTGLRPAALRLYDPLDTLIVGSRGTESAGGLSDYLPLETLARRIRSVVPGFFKSTQRFMHQYARLANKLEALAKDGALMILVFEGSERVAGYEHETALRICERLDGRNRGPEPAHRWFERRHHVSFLMNKVYYHHAFVDTIEVATTWDRVVDLYESVREAIKPIAFIMAHFSHAYPEGCSIYFTFLSSAPTVEDAETTHRKVWDAAMEQTVRLKATVSHHHGIGLFKSRYLREELGEIFSVYRHLKDAADPAGLLNPGKMGL
ncbi:FAD-binding oxidoreductase [bacterium]|nr:FAD-binding oxidoreductase [bacterium]